MIFPNFDILALNVPCLVSAADEIFEGTAAKTSLAVSRKATEKKYTVLL